MKTKIILNAAALLLIAICLLPTISFAQLIAGGTGFSLAVCSDGTVNAWGGNTYGQLGNGTNTNSLWPVYVSGLTGITAVAGGGGNAAHALALKNNGTVWAWGDNDFGQLGNGTNTDSNTPVQVSGLTGITAVACAAGWDYSLALKNNGTVWTWGDNSVGQLGNGTNISSNIPVQASGLTGITAIAGGAGHALALKNDGTLWAWGWNWAGTLGTGNNTDSNTPVQVSVLSGVTAIAAGALHSLALKNDGTVWAWGDNLYGQCANGGGNTPVQVSGLLGVIAITGDQYYSAVLKNDGTIWTWGENSTGQLGNGTNINSNTPVQAIAPTGITLIDAGDQWLMALKNDGTVWATGYHGNVSSSNILTQVDSLCYVGTTTPCNLSVSAGSDESTFFGYSGDQQVTRTAVVSGGTAPYTYSWTIGRTLMCNSVTSAGDEIFSGGTCANTVCPTSGTLTGIATCTGSVTVTVRVMDTTEVCVTVTDANNCTATDCFTVMAQDVRCFAGNSNNYKVNVCHHTGSNTNPWVQICVANEAVPAHLANNDGDYVGTCVQPRYANSEESEKEMLFELFPNPAHQIINILFTSDEKNNYDIQLLDVTGRLVKGFSGTSAAGENKRQLDLENIATGVYQVVFIMNEKREVKKLFVK